MKPMGSFSILLLVLLLLIGYPQKEDTCIISERDKTEIEALQKRIPLVLSNEEWETYEKLFIKEDGQ
jgi:hypothetical protein